MAFGIVFQGCELGGSQILEVGRALGSSGGDGRRFGGQEKRRKLGID